MHACDFTEWLSAVCLNCLSLPIILFTASPSILIDRFVVIVVFIVSSCTQVQFVLH